MREHGLDVQGGIDYVDMLTRQAMSQYIALRDAVPSWGEKNDSDVRKFIAGLDHWVLGGFMWSLNSERYFGKDYREVAKTLTFELASRRDGLPPLPVNSQVSTIHRSWLSAPRLTATLALCICSYGIFIFYRAR